MRRISSLPTAEHCPRVDQIGLDIETTQSQRSTVFHAYCESGVWPDDIMYLPVTDQEEIQRWKVPEPFVYTPEGVIYALQYPKAERELRVALDSDFRAVDVPKDVAQSDIAELYPNVMVCGHLDMAWSIPERDLAIVCDIKSSIFAVKDRTDSLQLHGYGLAYCALRGIGRYLPAIWDASDGRYYAHDHAIVVDGFEAEDIKDRITRASAEREGGFLTGTHCSGCWKRKRCPAHLVDVPDGEFRALLSGDATEAQVREALVRHKQLKDLSQAVGEAVESWVEQHGPVRSEDGKHQYRCELRTGRQGLDRQAVARALGKENLDDFITTGKPFTQFAWRKLG